MGGKSTSAQYRMGSKRPLRNFASIAGACRCLAGSVFTTMEDLLVKARFGHYKVSCERTRIGKLYVLNKS